MLGWLLNGLLFCLSYVVPKRKGLLAMGSRQGEDFAENTKYLFLHALREKVEFETVWLTRSDDVKNHIGQLHGSCTSLKSINGFWSVLRADALIIEQNALDVSYASLLFGRFRIVQTWHGTPMKRICADVPRSDSLVDRLRRYIGEFQYRRFWMIITPSQKESEILAGAFLNDNVQVTGYPRNDVLFDLSLAQHNFHEELSLSGRVVLYAPTFRSRAVRPFSRHFLQKLDAWCVRNETLFLVKRHPYDKGLDIRDYENIRDISSVVMDIQELLPHVDILVSDYSGVFFDFVLLDRPIIFYGHDVDEYVSENGLYYDYHADMPGPFAHGEEEFLDTLSRIDEIFKDGEYRKRYGRFKKRFNHFDDGGSSGRFYRVLQKSL